GQKQQVDRLSDRRLGRHVHKRAVAYERGIQRGERPVLRCDILAEMLAHEILSMGHDVGKALNVVEERRRERALKKTVNKNKAGSSLEQQEGADVVERGDARRRLRQRERSLGNRRDARK